MDHPLAHGRPHRADQPAADPRAASTRADLVLNLGTLLTDMNLGSRPPQITRDRSIWAVGNRVNVELSTPTPTSASATSCARCSASACAATASEVTLRRQPEAGSKRPLNARDRASTDMLREVNRFLDGKRGYAVVAESGDMLFAGLDVRIGRGGAYLAQGYYASMGFGVPGRARRADRHRQASDRPVRRRGVPDDRAPRSRRRRATVSARSSC